MSKYRKKPVVIEAHQWFKNGDHPEDDCRIIKNEAGEDFLSEGKIVRRYRLPVNNYTDNCVVCGQKNKDHGWVDTLEDGHRVCPSDYIIKGVAGEYYPCKESIFKDSYEAVE